jgi:hypothetical protein
MKKAEPFTRSPGCVVTSRVLIRWPVGISFRIPSAPVSFAPRRTRPGRKYAYRVARRDAPPLGFACSGIIDNTRMVLTRYSPLQRETGHYSMPATRGIDGRRERPQRHSGRLVRCELSFDKDLPNRPGVACPCGHGIESGETLSANALPDNL